MKTLRQVCAAFVLMLALTLSAHAGEIHTGIVSPPPSQPSTTRETTGEISTTVAGEIHTGLTATNPATEIALNLILNVFSLI